MEMADRVSARRNLANTFFLPLNSMVSAVVAGTSADLATRAPGWLLPTALMVLLGQCAAWAVMVRSHRQLNAAMFKVVHIPLAYVEQWVLVIYCAAYLVGFMALAI
nr:hypothetical protein [Streptomyces benahoarensis]